MALRLPGTWEYGRFLDEEVTVFFAYAWNFDPSSALFRPFAGYWNLAANGITAVLVSAVKAGLISLENAPYVTMLLGLASQLLPIALLLTGEANWLRKRSVRFVACLLVALAPGVDEVYLNVVHIQFHLALCVGIILALDAPTSRAGKLLSGTILLTAPLCGPGAILFLPLFGLRALLERDRARFVQVGILAAGTAIQLLIFYTPSAARGVPMAPVLLGAALFVRIVVLAVLGPLMAVVVGNLGQQAEMAGNPWILPLFAGAAVAAFAALAWWSLKRRDGAVWLVGSALLVAIISFGLGAAGQSSLPHRFALTPYNGPRYNYIPLVLLALAMLVFSTRPDGRGRKIARGLVIVYLVMAGLSFRIALPEYANGVSWRGEVAAWRADPDYKLRAWPRQVTADLSGRRYPCPGRFPAHGNPADPRYCESGWVSAFYPNEARQR
ncbi:hypothetical protein [Sphingomonas humi]|uniref:DUF2029 domain-containing protein n=1 Tax=Sphingomonas humi TaxID=335630 RepID=A0ABP7S782_9SPHN